ncbi:MAG TPA: SprT family zinc-dependent metalloprotease [Mariprofundaceae bacterium]|nr:SprT family zinc-dependent metalloprotease [Mariprofundaceae bacterium]
MPDSPSDDFPYDVVRRPRRRTVGITVKPDGSVIVAVPSRFPEWRIAELVRQKSGWIRKKRQQFLSVAADCQPKAFVCGETFELLGKKLVLQFVEDGAQPVRVDGDCLYATLPGGLDARQHTGWLSERVLEWYRATALEHFRERVRQFVAPLGVAPATVGIKSYRSRWGSCHRDGRIYFNWRLVMAPAFVVDYVVIHELCHLLQHDHSPRFWRHVEAIYPSYREARCWLKVHGHRLDL